MRVLMFIIYCNLTRCLGKTFCIQKYKKMDIMNLIIGAL